MGKEIIGINMAVAKRVQLELAQILIPLTNPKKRPSFDEARVLVGKLVRKFKQWNIPSKWEVDYQVTGRRPPGPTKSPYMPEEMTWKMTVTSRAGETIWVDWSFFPQTYHPRNLEEWVYSNLKYLLERRKLHNLRSCPKCERFFVSKDLRKQFCSTPCRSTFNNRQRQDSGYFQNNREKNRTLDLTKARRLFKEGKSLDEILRETGLPLRALKREGLVKR